MPLFFFILFYDLIFQIEEINDIIETLDNPETGMKVQILNLSQELRDLVIPPDLSSDISTINGQLSNVLGRLTALEGE